MPSLPGFSTDDESHFDLFEEMAIAKRDELRSRLVKIGIGFVLAFIVGLFLTRPLVGFGNGTLNFVRTGLDPAEVTTTDFFKTGLSVAIAFSLLLAYYEIVAFVSPVLTRKEKRTLYGSLPFVVLFFLFGTAFTYLVVLPRLIWYPNLYRLGFYRNFFTFSPADGNFRSIFAQVSLAMGSASALIFILFMLARAGIMSPKRMSASRSYALAIALAAAAIVTPKPFPINMLPVAAVLCLLYELGIVFANIAARRRNPQSQQYDDDTPALAR
jgi:sec-independent protein translocase protein TatC